MIVETDLSFGTIFAFAVACCRANFFAAPGAVGEDQGGDGHDDQNGEELIGEHL